MKVIFRVWIDGKLVAREETDGEGAPLAEFQQRHRALVEEDPTKEWMVEIEMPELPENERFFRFGTDANGMREPMTLDRLGDHPWAQ